MYQLFLFLIVMLLNILLLFTLDNADCGVEPNDGISFLGIISIILLIGIIAYFCHDYSKNCDKDDYYDSINRRDDNRLW